jgi:hypothetical protein
VRVIREEAFNDLFGLRIRAVADCGQQLKLAELGFRINIAVVANKPHTLVTSYGESDFVNDICATRVDSFVGTAGRSEMVKGWSRQDVNHPGSRDSWNCGDLSI